MIRWPLQERVPNRTVDQIVDVSVSQPRRNLEVFSVVSDALISPEKWTAPLAQTLGEMKFVNIKLLRWSLCDRAGCTYCLKSLIGKWQNCTLMHSVRSFHLCDNSGLVGEVSPLRGSPGTKKIRAESSSNGSEIAECRVHSAQNFHAELPSNACLGLPGRGVRLTDMRICRVCRRA